MATRTGNRGGKATIEFTLVGIPLVFVLISTVEMARGMWIYHTLAHAVREGTRFTIVQGADCKLAANKCTVKVADIAGVIQNAAVGLYDADNFMVEMKSLTDDIGPITLN